MIFIGKCLFILSYSFIWVSFRSNERTSRSVLMSFLPFILAFSILSYNCRIISSHIWWVDIFFSYFMFMPLGLSVQCHLWSVGSALRSICVVKILRATFYLSLSETLWPKIFASSRHCGQLFIRLSDQEYLHHIDIAVNIFFVSVI